ELAERVARLPPLDLDHVGAEVREPRRDQRTGDDRGELDDLDALERRACRLGRLEAQRLRHGAECTFRAGLAGVGRVGVFSVPIEVLPRAASVEFGCELEELGYGALWFQALCDDPLSLELDAYRRVALALLSAPGTAP